jgi:Undecaprenyl-phosphate galactose phosphotransferase WbaP
MRLIRISDPSLALAPSVAAVPGMRSRDASGIAGRVRKSRRRLARLAALVVGDAASGVLALATAQLLVHLASGSPVAPVPTPATGILLLIFLALGLYDGFACCPYARFRTRCIGVAVFAALLGVMVGPDAMANRAFTVVMEMGLLIAFGFYAELFVRHLLKRARLWAAPAVIVGCNARARELYHALLADPELGARPVGFLRTPADGLVSIKDFPAPVRDDSNAFDGANEETPMAILTSTDQLSLLSAGTLRPHQGRLVLVSDAGGVPILGVRVRPFGSSVGIQLKCGTEPSYNRTIKRIIDLCVAVPAAILLAPLIGALCLLISWSDRGSPLYWQQRIGARGRTFYLPKLRTMYRDADVRLQEHLASNPDAAKEWQRYFKLTDDPRVLPAVGSFLRRFSLDELPQLWSVIVGDMTLVGPRPFPQYHLNSFDPEFQRMRTTVVPGLTGLWQITDRSNGDLDVQRTQDTFYIRNWSIWLDLYILFKTVPAVLIGEGAR